MPTGTEQRSGGPRPPDLSQMARAMAGPRPDDTARGRFIRLLEQITGRAR